MTSQRAKKMLSMVAETSATISTDLQQRSVNDHQSITSTNNKKEKEIHPTKRQSINGLYSRPYSMTSTVFENFCETQNTLSSHHFHELESHLVILNKNFPKSPKENITGDFVASSSQIRDVITPLSGISCGPMNLTCHEEIVPTPQEQQQLELNNEGSLLVLDNDEQSEDNTMPGSPVPITVLASLDYDSDDSVLDKNYVPSDSSDDSEDDQPARSKKHLSTAKSTVPEYVLPDSGDDSEDNQLARSKKHLSTTTSTVSAPYTTLQPPLRTAEENLTKKRRRTVDFSEMRCTVVSEKISRKRRNTYDFIGQREEKESNSNEETENENNQQASKRRRYETSLAQRKTEKKDRKRMEYTVKPGCKERCQKKCFKNFNEQDRVNLNEEYWALTWEQRRLYVISRIETAIPKRKTTSVPKRNQKRSFRLYTRGGTTFEVCKIFFLTTLGYKETNDKVLRIDNLQSTGLEEDKRGKHQKTPPFDRQLLSRHVESFHPKEPHYRREHAPLRRYLPSDINITDMHKHFEKTHRDQSVSYELYRKYVKSMNISFTRLGNEECEQCEAYDLHKNLTSHDATTQIVAECSTCVEYAKHHDKYTKARQFYAFHKTFPQDDKKVFFTADLEKVIMLPRMEKFQSVIFAQRLVAYNQTFAPAGTITNQSKPTTVLWHDAIAGRKQEDIMSAFYVFMIRNRDVRNVNIWVDNCSAQNKNWLLFSMLVHLINSDLICTSNINLHYFERGHTFMSSDQVHKQVELAMKKMGKLYDFTDFAQAVASINNGKVSVESMTPQDFINVPDFVSQRRIKKTEPRAYLKDMVQVSFQRNNLGLLYKNDFDDEFTSLQFMNDKYLKNPRALCITFRTSPKGIDAERKAGIIAKCGSIIPPHKLLFWKNLPTSD